jgi:hypothetical protein
MAALRCAELTKRGDKEGVASWRKILRHVRAGRCLRRSRPLQRMLISGPL